jgi:hypothetical protein
VNIAELSELVRSIVGDAMGSYVVSKDVTIDAFAVVPPHPKQGWKAVGLEVILAAIPQVVDTGMFANSKQRQQLWEITLTQADRSDLTTLSAVRDRLMLRLPRSSQIYQPQTEDSRESCTVRFQTSILVTQR